MKILVTTYPFSEDNKFLNSYNTVYNNKKRKLSQEELEDLLINENPHIIIAGTETYDDSLLSKCTNLQMISRVGIGLDSIDIEACLKRNILVTNTPDAPSNAVAEMTI